MLLISTAKHSLEELVEVGRHVDGYELGIGYIEDNKKLCSVLGERIVTIHNLPALAHEEESFMMEPSVNPEGSAKMVATMVKRVAAMLNPDSWKIYGVHAGLRGRIRGPSDFTVEGKLLSFKKCLENIKTFYSLIEKSVKKKIALENIYGGDELSPAVGMDEKELHSLSKTIPLLLDLGHLAVNCAYRGVPLESLNFKSFHVAEIHVSFLHPKIGSFAIESLKEAPMFWDHHPYTNTYVNRQILNIANQLADKAEFLVLEINGTLKETEKTLEKLSFAREPIEGR